MTSSWNTTWGYSTSSNTIAMTPLVYVNEPSTIAVMPQKPKPKTPLEWLRDQVDDVCQLARDAA